MIKYKNLSDLRDRAKAEGMKGTGRKSEDDIRLFFLELGKEIVNEAIEEVVEKIVPDILPDAIEEKIEEVIIKTLKFAASGWCNKLKQSYKQGLYQPKDKAEYEALKSFAEGE